MRHLIILSGNSLKNKAWGELVQSECGPQFDSVYLQQYEHWVSGEQNINFEVEQATLAAHVVTMPVDTEIILFAKSAGSLLAFLAIAAGVVTPSRCVFFGIPFDLAAVDLFKNDWTILNVFKIPAIAFHNQDDPTTSYEFTKTTIEKYAPHIKLLTTNETDHWYGDFTTYSQHLNHVMR